MTHMQGLIQGYGTAQDFITECAPDRAVVVLRLGRRDRRRGDAGHGDSGALRRGGVGSVDRAEPVAVLAADPGPRLHQRARAGGRLWRRRRRRDPGDGLRGAARLGWPHRPARRGISQVDRGLLALHAGGGRPRLRRPAGGRGHDARGLPARLPHQRARLGGPARVALAPGQPQHRALGCRRGTGRGPLRRDMRDALVDHNDVRPRTLLVLIGSTRETRPPCSIVTTPKKKKGLRPGSMPSEEAVRRLEAVTDTALARLSLEELLSELLVRVRSILGADTAAILLLNGGDLVTRVAKGLEEEVEAGVRIPLRVATEDTRAHEAREGSASEELTPLCGLRVLVVDDEPDTCEVLEAVLREAGAEVRACQSTAEALAELDTWWPDVLLSDIGMPGEDGYSLIRRVRARERGMA